MVTKADLQSDLKQAMRNSERLRTSTLRMALSSIKFAEVDKMRALSPDEITGILQREVKSRRETIDDARKANRPDIIQGAEAELEILGGYLPTPLSNEELDAAVRSAIQATGAEGMSDMGKVIGAVMAEVGLRAEGRRVSEAARRLLGGA
jgi:uncharacterized protein YqeY